MLTITQRKFHKQWEELSVWPSLKQRLLSWGFISSCMSALTQIQPSLSSFTLRHATCCVWSLSDKTAHTSSLGLSRPTCVSLCCLTAASDPAPRKSFWHHSFNLFHLMKYTWIMSPWLCRTNLLFICCIMLSSHSHPHVPFTCWYWWDIWPG